MGGFDISKIIQEIALVTPGFLLAITVHEFTHAYVADKLGDPTARLQGRLTFNPISHLDPLGAVVLVVTRMIGWAKPVPVDPRNLANPRRDMLWISLGGPAANLIAAVVLSVVLHALVISTRGPAVGETARLVLDPLKFIIFYGMRINAVLAVFNLLPVPPLDGAKVIAGLLPARQAYQFEKLEPYGFPILFLLIFTNVLDFIISPPIGFLMALLTAGLR